MENNNSNENLTFVERHTPKKIVKDTYVAFSGSDFIITLKGKVLREVLSLTTDSVAGELILDLTVFDNIFNNKCKEFYKTVENDNIVEIMATEHGDKAIAVYKNIKYKGRKRKHSIDSLFLKEQIIFEYNEDLVEYPEWEEGMSIYDIIKKYSYPPIIVKKEKSKVTESSEQ